MADVGHLAGDIFLSYARKDKCRAKKLLQALQDEGRTVWWDYAIQAGEEWRPKLESALTEAKCVIVLWSKHSVKSPFVRDEAQKALDDDKLIQAIIDDGVRPPVGFGEYQVDYLIAWSGDRGDVQFKTLVAHLSRFFPEPADCSDLSPESKKRVVAVKLAFSLIAAIVVLAACFWFLFTHPVRRAVDTPEVTDADGNPVDFTYTRQVAPIGMRTVGPSRPSEKTLAGKARSVKERGSTANSKAGDTSDGPWCASDPILPDLDEIAAIIIPARVEEIAGAWEIKYALANPSETADLWHWQPTSHDPREDASLQRTVLTDRGSSLKVTLVFECNQQKWNLNKLLSVAK